MNTLNHNIIRDHIEKYQFFSGLNFRMLPERERQLITKKQQQRKASKKTVLYREGEFPEGVYFLQQGKVKLTSMNKNGSEQCFLVYGEGEMFGHRPILSNEAHSMTATTLEACELHYISRADFEAVVTDSEELSRMLLQQLSHEFKVLINRLNVLSCKGAKERVALFLLLLNEKFRKPDQNAFQSEIQISRSDLAAFSSTTLETAVRTLREFKDRNFVRLEGRSIYLVDVEGLFNLAIN
jgi:CRP-like cAMP-binding protein